MKRLIFLTVTLFSYVVVFGQNLNEQFKTLNEDAETFKVYKVIKKDELNQFWSIVNDSIDHLKNQHSDAQRLIKIQENELAKMEELIQENNNKMLEQHFATTHINVLGIEFLKASYIIINFILIIGLMVGLGMLFFKFKESHIIANKKTSRYENLDKEFDDYKKRALEKQMRLRRDLQTTMNRLEEIKSA